jgi:hypothetical protein
VLETYLIFKNLFIFCVRISDEFYHECVRTAADKESILHEAFLN